MVIEDAGHLTNMERPVAFNEAVLEFLLGVLAADKAKEKAEAR